MDREGEALHSPLDITAENVAELIAHAAQVLEMHLIEDHTRQQDAPDASRIDSSQDLHWQILPLAHPAEFADLVQRMEGERPTNPGSDSAP